MHLLHIYWGHQVLGILEKKLSNCLIPRCLLLHWRRASCSWGAAAFPRAGAVSRAPGGGGILQLLLFCGLLLGCLASWAVWAGAAGGGTLAS